MYTLYVKTTISNAFITLVKTTDVQTIIFSITTGILGYKKAKRSTLYSIESLAEYAAKLIKKLNTYSKPEINIVVSGTSNKKKISILKTLKKAKIKSKRITEKVIIIFNGCRKKKIRRL
uniref:Ribosomal protein S11 n=1 Tax=Cyanoptyche gloeocystis TaxID=77922 RepID=A0A096Y6U3_9EUKA|nr:ribosomal protein S11 [Cyanoptyche gloeocystis]AIM52055.1 ribosomal protein S11 [Cyanoptyche gloeocystis]